ncbi:AAA family ATPase, partial [bacterium]|nr:AAA family ATPase [bacterium]
MPTYIKKIEIKHFRSIYELEIKNIGSQRVITGSNDVGKSNILRALNLFFNGEIEPGIPLVFERDFNITEKERIKERKKVKQSISIKLTVEPPKTFKSLGKKRVQIRKTWYRDGFKEEYFLNRRRVLETARGERMTISKLKNKMIFEYVPAL